MNKPTPQELRDALIAKEEAATKKKTKKKAKKVKKAD